MASSDKKYKDNMFSYWSSELKGTQKQLKVTLLGDLLNECYLFSDRFTKHTLSVLRGLEEK